MCRTHGAGTTKIERYIRQNNYEKVEKYLETATGFIGGLGGRYCIHLKGTIYLDHIFSAIDDQHLDTLSPEELPDSQRFAAGRVLGQLRTIYDETQARLSGSSRFARYATRGYDLINQKLLDGYSSGIQRLEDVVLPKLHPPCQYGASSQERDLPGILEKIALLMRNGKLEDARKLYDTLPMEF